MRVIVIVVVGLTLAHAAAADARLWELSDPAYRQGHASVASRAGGTQALVAWARLDSEGQPIRVQTRIVEPNGKPRGLVNDLTAPPGEDVDLSSPAVAAGPGGYLMTWIVADTLYAARVDTAGVAAQPHVVGPVSGVYGSLPRVVYNSATHEYLALWSVRQRATDSVPEIFAQRLSPDGAPLASAARIAGARHGIGDQEVAVNPRTGEYLVVWSATTSTRSGVMSRILSPQGQPAPRGRYLPQAPAATPVAVQWTPRPRGFVVGWGGADIHLRRLDPAGRPEAGRGVRIDQRSEDARITDVEVAQNPRSRRVLLVWREGEDFSSYSNLYAQIRRSSDLSLRRTRELAQRSANPANPFAWATGPVIAATEGAGFLAVWTGENSEASAQTILAEGL